MSGREKRDEYYICESDCKGRKNTIQSVILSGAKSRGLGICNVGMPSATVGWNFLFCCKRLIFASLKGLLVKVIINWITSKFLVSMDRERRIWVSFANCKGAFNLRFRRTGLSKKQYVTPSIVLYEKKTKEYGLMFLASIREDEEYFSSSYFQEPPTDRTVSPSQTIILSQKEDKMSDDASTVGLSTFWVYRMIDETKSVLAISTVRTLEEHEQILAGAYARACTADLPSDCRTDVIYALGLMLQAIRAELAKPMDRSKVIAGSIGTHEEPAKDSGPVLLSFAAAKVSVEAGGQT